MVSYLDGYLFLLQIICGRSRGKNRLPELSSTISFMFFSLFHCDQIGLWKREADRLVDLYINDHIKLNFTGVATFHFISCLIF